MSLSTIDTRQMVTYPGAVLQVVQSVYTGVTATTAGAGSPAILSGLSATISPLSASSKILVGVNIGKIGSNSDSTWGLFLFRDATKIYYGDVAGSRSSGAASGGIMTSGGTWPGQPVFIQYLDAPATTNAITYSLKFGGNGSSTITINFDARDTNGGNDATRTASSITLTEIAG